jgi:hypothetical protein
MAIYARDAVLGDKYRLDRHVGDGSACAVWLATNLGLDQRVGVKLLHGARRTPAAKRRLQNEAVAAGRVSHPAVGRVFDYGETEDGDAYLVMELLRGEPLRRHLEAHGPLRPERAVQMLLPIAHALAHAQRCDVVHRDVSPSSIFLVSDDGRVQPKLLDFGAAQLPEQSGRPTQNGPVGTAGYVAPELALADGPVDARVDVWSLAAVLYTMIRGEPPFPGQTVADTLTALLNEAPKRLKVDAGLWGIVERGLARAPDDRWPTMDAFGAALARWLLGRGVRDDVTGAALSRAWPDALEAAPERPRRRRRRRSIAVAAAMLTVPLALIPSYGIVRRDETPRARAGAGAVARRAVLPFVPATTADAPMPAPPPKPEADREPRRPARRARGAARPAPVANDARVEVAGEELPDAGADAAPDARPTEVDVYEELEGPAKVAPYESAERPRPDVYDEL